MRKQIQCNLGDFEIIKLHETCSPHPERDQTLFEKGGILVNDDISSITEENVIEKWGNMCEYND